MTRALDSGSYTALQQRRLVARDFIWFVVHNRTTGAAVVDGYWSGTGSMTADIIDPDTGNTLTRTWAGAYALIQISDIALVSSLTVQTISVVLSQVSDRVNNLVRTYECKQGRVEIYRGLFDPETRLLVAPATPRFVGTIDEAPVTTPAEGGEGNVTLTCTSNTQELTRSNPDTRSDASQRLRSGTDDFLADVVVVGGWQHFWGRGQGPVEAEKPPKPWYKFW